MTEYLRLVIVGLVAAALLAISGLIAIAVVQIVHGDGIDLPSELVTFGTSALTGLIGILVPAEIKSTPAPRGRGGEHTKP